MTSSPITVVFDLDGTMISTADDLLDSLNHILKIDGLQPLAADDVGFRLGQGARAMISHGYASQNVALEAQRLSTLTDLFVAHYGANIPGRSIPFPGLLPALDRLEAAGCRLAVCTNKFEALARKLLEHLDMAQRFAVIAGSDTYATRKPDAGHILQTIADAGGDPQRTVMIGDSISDIKGARNAGVASIGVPFGYSDVPIAKLEPDALISHFDELTMPLLHDLLAAPSKDARSGSRG
ncbi:HAD-IA family hydrolase [Pseudohoeflea coraliihabitans]|uniref:HAD-IA family hydrolase n=1 Tax=Pseudohoeflea coraliihabitans TaxID=2860393 RepID=A0ABS6WPZ4_9HYPH|nr:HAD-IA family hydrolase [Pseudohoeflea sp. DP4N28-3]MBW3098038.1 HAD-IA family hydrolase [Pseudohoeflea sp. DP4N28-3]